MLQGVPSAPPSICVNFQVLAFEYPPGRWLRSCLLGHWTPVGVRKTCTPLEAAIRFIHAWTPQQTHSFITWLRCSDKTQPHIGYVKRQTRLKLTWNRSPFNVAGSSNPSSIFFKKTKQKIHWCKLRWTSWSLSAYTSLLSGATYARCYYYRGVTFGLETDKTSEMQQHLFGHLLNIVWAALSVRRPVALVCLLSFKVLVSHS